MRTSPMPAVVAALLLLGGCNELPPIRYETLHLRIGTDFEGPVCAGTLHEFDKQVEVAEEALDFQIEGKLELYLFADSVSAWCKVEDAPGCYSHSTRQAYSTFPVARHEIVHAVTGQIHSGNIFFDEGFAIDLTGQGLGFPDTYPSSNLGLNPDKVSHRTAGHFMRWLRLQYTASEIESVWRHSEHNRGAAHAEAAFKKGTGDDFHRVEQEYFDSSADFFAPFDIVEPPIIASEMGEWVIFLEFDCDDVSTHGFDDEMWRRVRIEVVFPGYYIMVVTPPATATITLRRDEDIQVTDPFPEVPSWPIGDDLFDPPEPWPPGIPQDTWLDPGTYDIEVRVPGVSPTEAAVRIHPRLGPISEVP